MRNVFPGCVFCVSSSRFCVFFVCVFVWVCVCVWCFWCFCVLILCVFVSFLCGFVGFSLRLVFARVLRFCVISVQYVLDVFLCVWCAICGVGFGVFARGFA